MKLFKGGAEIRVDQVDLMELIEQAINENIRSSCKDHRYVTNLTLHPRNKYAARITISTDKPDN